MAETLEETPEIEAWNVLAFRPESLGDYNIEHAQRMPGLVYALEDLAYLGNLNAAEFDERQFVIVEDLLEVAQLLARGVIIVDTCRRRSRTAGFWRLGRGFLVVGGWILEEALVCGGDVGDVGGVGFFLGEAEGDFAEVGEGADGWEVLGSLASQ